MEKVHNFVKSPYCIVFTFFTSVAATPGKHCNVCLLFEFSYAFFAVYIYKLILPYTNKYDGASSKKKKIKNDFAVWSRTHFLYFIKTHALAIHYRFSLSGEFILSGGRYTDADEGPGFRFICSNCASASPSASTADRQKSKRFVLNLSTQTQDWKISLDFLPKAWFQFAFTWHVDHGLKVYKNGKLLAKNNKPESVNYRPLQYQTIVIGRPNSLTKMHYYGKFDIGHLVVWPYELSAYEVEVAFLTVLAKTTKSLICCHFKKGVCDVDDCKICTPIRPYLLLSLQFLFRTIYLLTLPPFIPP